jgi:predicted permease
MAFTTPQLQMLRQQTDTFTGIMAVLPNVNARLDSRTLGGVLVTSNFFEVLGASAAFGRTFEADENQPTLLLSHRAWTSIFESDRGIVGRTIRLNGQPFSVLGVMPPDFRGLNLVAPDYWAPLSQLSLLRPADFGREHEVELPTVVGRLRADRTVASATAELTAWAAGNDDLPGYREYPKTIQLVPRQGTLFNDAWQGLASFSPLFLVFGLVLLIGCANVANLLLARGVARQREIGIRLSLGASRRRVARQLVVESLLLSLAAVAGGFVVSRVFILGTLGVMASDSMPDRYGLLTLAAGPADWRVLVFLVLAAAVSTMAFAVVPACRATRVELTRTMRGEVMRAVRPRFVRHGLIAIQVCASALLLVTAVVFLRAALETASADPGIRVTETLFIDGFSETLRPSMLEAVRRDPAVADMAVIFPPGIGGRNATATAIETATGADGASRPVSFKLVSPEYFEVLGLRVLRGRRFTDDERSVASGVAVVSDRTARELWPDRQAVGQRLHIEPWQFGRRSGEQADPTPEAGTYAVVGVVPDAQVGIGGYAQNTAWVYLPTDAATAGTSLVVRSLDEPVEAQRGLSERLSAVDPAMGSVSALRDAVARGTFVLRLGFLATAALGALALALTVSGLVGVLSYLVEQRRREIGVRMALGATPARVLRLVLTQSLRPVVVGLLLGVGLAGTLTSALLALPAAMGVGRDVEVYDPAIYAISLLCIALPCAVAACVPAFRASRIDPIATLRTD